jgi:hypothetical protein
VEMTFFFIGFFIPSPISEEFCSKSELGVLQWGEVSSNMGDGFMGAAGSHKPNLTPMCVSDIPHTMHAYTMDEHVR